MLGSREFVTNIAKRTVFDTNIVPDDNLYSIIWLCWLSFTIIFLGNIRCSMCLADKIWFLLPNFEGVVSLYFTFSNTILMLFVVSQRNDDKRLVFFPLQSTLRKLCFVKFPMSGNLQYLIVDIVPSYEIVGMRTKMFAKNNVTVYCRFIAIAEKILN